MPGFAEARFWHYALRSSVCVFTRHFEAFGARFAAQLDIVKRNPMTWGLGRAAEFWIIRAPSPDNILECQAAHVNEVLWVLPASTQPDVKARTSIWATTCWYRLTLTAVACSSH